jgi:hypothetical protein
MAAFTIVRPARTALQEIARRRPGPHPVYTQGGLELAVERILAAADWNFEQPARMLDRTLKNEWRRDDDRRTLIAALALELPERVEALDLPASVIRLYPDAVDRLTGELLQGGAYDPDHYAKDVRFVLGLTVPVGGQIADVSYSLKLPARVERLKRAAGSAGRLMLAGEGQGLAAYLRSRPTAPYLQMHTEARDLSNFSPDGWDRAYVRAADILERRPRYGGLIGFSWFYDPAVAEISPRLSYLADRQLQNGALRIPFGPSPLQVELATAASETRRRLFEEGRYRPRCYAVVWPREALVSWAAGARWRIEHADRPVAA